MAGLFGATAIGAPSAIMGNPVRPKASYQEQGPGEPAVFPLSVSHDGRYLHDARGRPFLVTGDAAWSLVAELTHEEADFYLATRRNQGFNTVLVSLIEHKFSRNAPADAYGNQPFHSAGDFAQPNDRYFDNAHRVVERAGELGFLVLLTPAYLGSQGGEEGWFKELRRAGTDTLRGYGRYVATRFRDLKNIVWVHGGDFDDPDKSIVRAIVAGISEVEPRALHTVHSSRESDTAAYWRGDPWLGIDTIYTHDVYRKVSARYRRGDGLPIVMIEAAYENEHGADEQVIRAQAYGALLGGAAGQIYGNNPVWHFSGPGLYVSLWGWRHALANPGARSITHLSKLFAQLEWWKIEPDDGALLIDGGRTKDSYALCGVAADGSFAVCYAMDVPQLTFRLPWREAEPAVARWYDPAAGIFLETAPPAKPVPGGLTWASPARANTNGYRDWLLLLSRPTASSPVRRKARRGVSGAPADHA